MRWISLAVGLTAAVLLFSACDSLTGGEDKIIINEAVCGNAAFLNLTVGNETTIEVDNSRHSEKLAELVLIMQEFPMVITSELPPSTNVGPDFTSTTLPVAAGEKDSITIRPTFTGQYPAVCSLTYDDEVGSRTARTEIRFLIESD